MKHVLQALFVACALTALAACNQGGGGSSSNSGYAATPQPCNGAALGTPAMNCSVYNNYYSADPNSYNWYNGAWQFPQQYQIAAGSCGCPNGYFPVQSAYYGMACAPNAYRTGGFSGVVYYNVGSWGPYWNYSQNNGWLNRPQATYQPAGSINNCGQSTAQGCDVRNNNCPSGSRCQPVAGGSTIGLCVR
ncbi:MAG: hypothetical protein KF681_06725 [Bdellovibrionaceae bacterium]|nr:hypothetical protein [Pseudobdellovibrionaceae bacterium]